MRSLLLFSILVFSNSSMAASFEVSGLSSSHVKYSSADAHIVLSKGNADPRVTSTTLDVACVDGKMELRIMGFSSQLGFQFARFETDIDFYCGRSRALAEVIGGAGKKVVFSGEFSSDGQSLQKAVFTIEETKKVNLFERFVSTMNPGDLVRTR